GVRLRHSSDSRRWFRQSGSAGRSAAKRWRRREAPVLFSRPWSERTLGSGPIGGPRRRRPVAGRRFLGAGARAAAVSARAGLAPHSNSMYLTRSAAARFSHGPALGSTITTARV